MHRKAKPVTVFLKKVPRGGPQEVGPGGSSLRLPRVPSAPRHPEDRPRNTAQPGTLTHTRKRKFPPRGIGSNLSPLARAAKPSMSFLSLPPLGVYWAKTDRHFHRGILPSPPWRAPSDPVWPLPARCGLALPDRAGSQRGRGGRAAQEQISRCHTHSGSGAAQCAVGSGCPAPGGTAGQAEGSSRTPTPPSLPTWASEPLQPARAGGLWGTPPPAGLGPLSRHLRPQCGTVASPRPNFGSSHSPLAPPRPRARARRPARMQI